MSDAPSPRSLHWVRVHLLAEIQSLIEAVKELGDIIEDKVKPPKHIRTDRAGAFIEQVAAEEGYTVEELIGPRQAKDLCRARDIAIQRIRGNTELSLPDIGRLMGGRHHTTILAALRRNHDED